MIFNSNENDAKQPYTSADGQETRVLKDDILGHKSRTLTRSKGHTFLFNKSPAPCLEVRRAIVRALASERGFNEKRARDFGKIYSPSKLLTTPNFVLL